MSRKKRRRKHGPEKPERVLTFTRHEQWKRCRWLFLQEMRRATGIVTPEQKEAITVGKAVEEAIAVAAKDPVERVRVIEAQIQTLPPERREEARQKVEELVEVAEEVMKEEKGEAEPQVQYRFLDEAVGWTYVAKPDRVSLEQGWTDPPAEDKTKKGSRRSPVKLEEPLILKVYDDKTTGVWRERFKRLIFYFMMVVSLCNQRDKVSWPIEGIINLLGRRRNGNLSGASSEDGENGSKERKAKRRTFRYSGAREWKQLEDVREVVRGIDRAYEKLAEDPQHPEAAFPPQKDWDCQYCRQRLSCPLWLASHPEDAPLPAVTPAEADEPEPGTTPTIPVQSAPRRVALPLIA